MRSILGYVAWFIQFSTVKYLPLGIIQTVQNLSPFLTLILAYFILHEMLKCLEIINMCVSFCGVLIIVIFSATSQSEKSDQGTSDITTFQFVVAILMNLCAAAIVGLVSVLIRSLKSVHWSILSAFQSFTGLIVTIIIWTVYKVFISTTGFIYNFTLEQYLYMMVLGSASFLTQVLWIKALHFDKAGRCASMTMLNMVFGFFFDIVIFNYDMQIWEILGVCLIIGCSTLVIILKIYVYKE